ncbi:MAG: aryl-sulfate sulfotransferase [Deltaproteobacteria bacterium]|nr:aryl-sulfate sulfotransferase [Deltaproteobacteria bacterium]
MKDLCCSGYTLFGYAGPTPFALLVDMGGNVVHTWPFGGAPVKMMPGGSLLAGKRRRLGKDPLRRDPDEDSSQEPGPDNHPWQDTIEMIQVSWDGEEEWSFSGWDDDGTGVMMSRQHHDFQRESNPVGYYAPGQDFLPQGKTLVLSHKNKRIPEICKEELLDDVLYEVGREGKLLGFQWHAAEHFEEFGFDDTAKKAIYECRNFDKKKGFSDWLHLNSASYLGQNSLYDKTGDERFRPENIIISSRSANFVAIIDFGTGRIVWKLGPDCAEGSPEHRLGQIVGQHHAHMIPRGLPGEGHILLFDNGGKSGYGGPEGYPRYRREYSRVIEFDPTTFELVWQYGAERGKEHFFSHFISGAQRLPNGNTLITDGANGRIFEVTREKQVVWEFLAPAQGGFGNKVYRAYRVPPQWVPGNPAGYKNW